MTPLIKRGKKQLSPRCQKRSEEICAKEVFDLRNHDVGLDTASKDLPGTSIFGRADSHSRPQVVFQDCGPGRSKPKRQRVLTA